MLFLNNDDVKQVLTMEATMNALDQAYRELAREEAVCRPRIDIQIPTRIPKRSINGAPWKAARLRAISPSA